MFPIIMFRELRHNILSLRLLIALVLVITVMGLGSVAFVKDYTARREAFTRYQSQIEGQEKDVAERNITEYAVGRPWRTIAPRADAFIDDAREAFLPDRFQYNAFAVFGFDILRGADNPYLEPSWTITWLFVMTMVMSFVAVLFTFDAISGEKAAQTLALTLSNAVSRGTVMAAKFTGAVLTTLVLFVPGLCLSLVIILLSGMVALNAAMLQEMAVFIAVAALFIACMAALGLLASAVARSANVSLLVALAAWIVFVVIIPNTALFWARTLFPIESARSVDERVSAVKDDINKNAPDGSWSANGNDLFYPKHELRAANQTNLVNAEQAIRNANYQDMFRQYERVRAATWVSPVCIFEHLGEAIVGGGYVRFMHVWDGLHAFQPQLLTYFKAKDAADPDSPHWYNPLERYSTTRQGVSIEEVPRYTERPVPLDRRMAAAMMPLALLILYTGGLFMAAFVVFVRYDVR